ncbi:MAG: tetratricopeptide repeat protein [Spirochaetales bacterium]|nr:tetratricopeptide repeat protein [Spirochaetales bacterium]
MKKTAAILLLFCLPLLLYAQDKTEPAWVVFQKAKSFANQREYGKAIEYFKEALTMQKDYPEAEMAIADIYWQIEGEFQLAERHYQKALEKKNFFEIPNQKYEVMDKLGDLYLSWQRYFEYQHIQQSIISDDQDYNQREFQNFRDAYYMLYMDKGFDQLFRLFRLSGYPQVIKAHRELGWFLYRSGQYKEALTNLLFSLVQLLSESFEYFREFFPLYEYRTLNIFLKDLYANQDIASYLDQQDVYKTLYYLAATSYALGKNELSKEIFRLIQGSAYRGKYYALAGRQLNKAFIEDLLFIEKKEVKPNLDALVN